MSSDLPHIMPGRPRRSLYGDGNTHDQAVHEIQAMFQRLADSIGSAARVSMPADSGRLRASFDAERETIRVVAQVGEPIREIEAGDA